MVVALAPRLGWRRLQRTQVLLLWWRSNCVPAPGTRLVRIPSWDLLCVLVVALGAPQVDNAFAVF